MIIDTHLHTWDTAEVDISWLAAAGLPQKSPIDSPGYDQPGIGQSRIDAAQRRSAQLHTAEAERQFILVEANADDPAAEADWLINLARRDERVFGVVVSVALERGAGARAELERLAQAPEVLGVRRLLQDRPDFFSADFSKGLGLLEERGLPFDACVRAHQLPDLITLLQAHPQLTVVLDHMGKPPVDDEAAMRQWERGVHRLSEMPQVYCKLSGLPAECRDQAQLDQLAEQMVLTAFERFGPARCLVGSDRPVSSDQQDWCARVLGCIPVAHRAAVARGTAEHVYRAQR